MSEALGVDPRAKAKEQAKPKAESAIRGKLAGGADDRVSVRVLGAFEMRPSFDVEGDALILGRKTVHMPLMPAQAEE